MKHNQLKNICFGTGFIALDIIRNTVGETFFEKRYVGGSCGNVLSILSFLGWHSYAVGRIGMDLFGNQLLDDFKQIGVHTEFLKIEHNCKTPVVIQENFIDKKGNPRHRFLRTYPESNTFLPSYRPIVINYAKEISNRIPHHTFFFFDRVAPAILELAKLSRATGALVVFEPSNFKDERLFYECLQVAHIVKYSNERIKNAHRMVRNSTTLLEIETFGAEGLRLRLRDNDQFCDWIDFPAYKTSTFVDASGSGDWCTAGLVYQLFLHNFVLNSLTKDIDSIINAIKFGQALAALNCGYEGARGLMYATTSSKAIHLASSITGQSGFCPIHL